MSSVSPESELDLEKLFLPAWAQESPSINKYAGHSGEDRGERGRGRGGPRDDRGPRRDRPPGQGGGGGGPRGQNQGQRFGGPRPQGDRPRGPRPGGPGGDQRAGGGRPDRRGPGGGRPGEQRGERFERREPLPLPEVEVTFLPDQTAIDVLARQIRTTGRAYPLVRNRATHSQQT